MKMNKNTIYFPGSSSDVAFTATPAPFTTPNQIYQMRVIADQDCKITWQNAGTIKIAAGIPEYLACQPGDTMTVTRVSSDGTLNVGWMTN